MFESDGIKPSLTDGLDMIRLDRWRQSPDWLNETRAEGKKRFEAAGLPSRKLEEWKYTDISPIEHHLFAPPSPPTQELLDSLQPDRFLETAISPVRLVFINGFYSPHLSMLTDLPKGVTVAGLGEAIKQDHPLLKPHLSVREDAEESSFAALNSAYMEDGALVHISRNTRLEHPVHLVFINAGKQMPTAVYPRNLVVAEPGAEVIIFEDYVGGADTTYFTNAVTDIVVGEQAGVRHYKLQRENEASFHVAAIRARQAVGGRFESHNITFGGRLTRNDIHAHLDGNDSSCTLNGLYMIRGSQHVDNHTLIRHNTPRCGSSELYHGILDGKARGVFNGKVYVKKDAQHTDSRQSCKTLLLSREAAVDAKPELEIFADDVKCAHAATVGRLDADALYYLRSRGITAKQAEKMLTLAFARRVIDNLNHPGLEKITGRLLSQQLDHSSKQVS